MANTENKTNYWEIFLKNEWSYVSGAVLLSVIATGLLSLTGAPWGVTGIFATWGGKFISLFGVNADSWSIFNGSLAKYNFWKNQTAMLDVGIIVGALVACLLAASFKIKKIRHIKQVFAALLGGLLMGIGARLSLGCNIGALFTAFSAMSLHGWVFALFIFLGGIAGSKLLTGVFMTENKAADASARKQRVKLTAEQKKRKKNIQILIGIVVLSLWVAVSVFAESQNQGRGFFIMIIGLLFGYVLQRSRFCFTSAIRDPALTGGTNLTKAVIITIALNTFLMLCINMAKFGIDPAALAEAKIPGLSPVGTHTAIGGFLFGIGAVIAGGCASGTLMRMGEGFVQQWIAFITFVIGSILGMFILNSMKSVPVLYTGKTVFLPAVLGGWLPAAILQFAVLFALYIAADKWGKKKLNQF